MTICLNNYTIINIKEITKIDKHHTNLTIFFANGKMADVDYDSHEKMMDDWNKLVQLLDLRSGD